MAQQATAQERARVAGEIAAGWVGFADDGVVSEGMVGGAVRWYVSPRVSVGPEIIYIDGSHHAHWVLTGNVTWDIVAPVDSNQVRIVPFASAGGGVFWTREMFLGGTFTSSDGAFTAGGGVKAFVTDRVTVGVEARVGWELHVRVNGLVGVQLGR